MERLRIIALVILASAPMLGLLATSVAARALALRIMRGLALGSLIVGVALLIDVAQSGNVISQSLGTWLSLPYFAVTFTLVADGLSLVQLILASTVLCIALRFWPRRGSLGWLSLAWCGVTLAAMANNLGQLFVGWTLSAWASSELSRRCGENAARDERHRPVWLIQRASDAVLLTGVCLSWLHFGSLEFSIWTNQAISSLRSELIEGLSVCILIGVIGRCAQLPLTVWLETEAGFAARAGESMVQLSDRMVGLWNVPDGHHLVERMRSDPNNQWHSAGDKATPAAVLAWWLSAAFLPIGVGLLWRCLPLLAAAEHTRLLLTAVGAFTVLTTSMSAAAQNNWSRVLSQIAVGQCGWALLSLGMLDLSARVSGLLLLASSSLFVALLLVANDRCDESRRRFQLAIALCLASGLFGRHSVANVIWEQTSAASAAVAIDPATGLPQDPEHESMVFGATSSTMLALIVGLLCLSELLTAFAVFRAWYRNRELPAVAMAESETPAADWSLWLLLGSVILGSAVLGQDVQSCAWWLGLTDQALAVENAAAPRAWFGIGNLLPLSAAGIVAAWWLYSRPSSAPQRAAEMLGPFARLSRNRFYWDDLYFLLIVHPATVCARWLQRLDHGIGERDRESDRARWAQWVSDAAAPLANGSWPTLALTTLSSVVVLAWILLWLRTS